MIPEIHAENSIKRWGGNREDFERFKEIHQFMDSSKAAVSDNRHRFLNHNSWFVVNVLPRLFGDHVKVTIDREGNIKTKGYEHD